MAESVLVTGGSGYLASHILVRLLKAGYNVRTTIRSSGRRDDILDMIKNGGVEPGDNLSFYLTDLTKDKGWKEAIEGCKYVIHVASPIFSRKPDSEDEFIRPAVDGTLRVLKLSRDAEVERVVFTSSFVAIGYGHDEQGNKPFDETSWSDITVPNTSPYVKSKTLAEKAAWDFMEKEGGKMELSVINPSMILGPVLGPKVGTSVEIGQMLMNGTMKYCPKLTLGIADVRDTAEAHLRAMTDPKAAGQRYIVTSDEVVSFYNLGQALKPRYGNKGYKLPSGEIPNWVIWIVSFFSYKAKQITPMLGHIHYATTAKVKKELGIVPRPWQEIINDTAQSLIDYKLI